MTQPSEGPETPLALQRSFWNDWNGTTRERELPDVSLRQREVVLDWIARLERRDLNIIDIGCGAGWLCGALTEFGRVTGTDLADEVLARASLRVPEARFLAGDFMTLDLPRDAYDVAVCLEVLSHVADQPAFLHKIATLLHPRGYLMLATQNRPILERNNVPPPRPGQLRRWVDARELRTLLSADFQVIALFTVSPIGNRGVLRLVNSYKLNRLVRLFVGNHFERLKEKMGLGWTLMALSRTGASP